MYKVSGSSPVAIPVVLSLRYPMSPSKYAPYTFSPFNVVGAFVASVPVSGVPLAPPVVPEQDYFAGAIDRKSCQWCIVFVDRIDLVRLRQQHRTAEF